MKKRGAKSYVEPKWQKEYMETHKKPDIEVEVVTEPQTLIGKVALRGLENITGYSAETFDKKYVNTMEGFLRFKAETAKYFQYLVNVSEEAMGDLTETPFPSLEMWATYIGISRSDIRSYEIRGGVWTDFIRTVKNTIHAAKSQLADHGKIPPMTYIFDAVNNYGMQNTNQVNNSQVVAPQRIVKSVDELPMFDLRQIKGPRDKQGKLIEVIDSDEE